jgi:predicted enzyme related to lactoylglutathione lyase
MPTLQRISYMMIIVRDLDTAFKWYADVLGFEKRTDISFGPSSERWVVMGLPDQPDFGIFLKCPKLETHGPDLYAFLTKRIGTASGMILTTPDCRDAHRELLNRGVRFLSEPSELPWGITATFEDLYGNTLVLFQQRDAS